MPNWLPGASKQNVPQAPYFISPPAAQPSYPRPLASRSTSDLKRIDETPERYVSRSELPYRREQNVPPVPSLPSQYAAAPTRYRHGPQASDGSSGVPAMQGRSITPTGSDPSEGLSDESPTKILGDSPTDPQYLATTALEPTSGRERPRMGRLANFAQAQKSTPGFDGSSFVFPAPKAPQPAQYTPPVPQGPQMKIFDLRYHTEPVEFQPGVFQVEMRYKARITDPSERHP